MSRPEPQGELPSSQAMMQILTGKWISRAVSVAATLGIADLLVDGPQSVEKLATATSTHADSLYRLLRACERRNLLGNRRPPVHAYPIGRVLAQ